MAANENSGEPQLTRQLRASVAWAVWRGTRVADAMPAGERERTVGEMRDERAEGRAT